MEKTSKALAMACHQLQAEGRTHEGIYMAERIAADAVNALAMFRLEAGDTRLPVRLLEMASKIDTNNWMVFNNLCHIHNSQGRFVEAKEAISQAIACVGEDTPEPYYNAGVVCQNLQQTLQAIEMYRTALRLGPQNQIARYNLACSLLLHGDFEEGWREYEARLTAFEETRRMASRFKAPVWQGSDLKGKSICVYSEQGVGDFIQFARFLPMLKAKGATVVAVEVQERLAPLLGKRFKIDKLITRTDREDEWPEPPLTDYSLSVASLPGILKATPKTWPTKPYFKAPKKPALPLDPAFKVGFCWAGNSSHKSDSMRSLPLRLFRPLTELPGLRFYSLQKSDGPRKWPAGIVDLREGSEGMNYIDLAPQMHTFAETAAFIDQMDLIISVDTSVAHLAGALGKPTWILLATVCDWRWLENREDSPWYPSVRLIRQTSYQQWQDVFDRLLEELASGRKNRGPRGKNHPWNGKAD